MSPAMSVKDQLEKILSSTALASSPSLSCFLRYIVEETLAGRHAAIREYTLGVHVFHRGTDFNPRRTASSAYRRATSAPGWRTTCEGPGAEDPVPHRTAQGHVRARFPLACGGAHRSAAGCGRSAHRESLCGFGHAGSPAEQPGGRAAHSPLLDRGRSSSCSFCWASPHCDFTHTQAVPLGLLAIAHGSVRPVELWVLRRSNPQANPEQEKAPPRASVVVVSRNRVELLRECLLGRSQP